MSWSNKSGECVLSVTSDVGSLTTATLVGSLTTAARVGSLTTAARVGSTTTVRATLGGAGAPDGFALASDASSASRSRSLELSTLRSPLGAWTVTTGGASSSATTTSATGLEPDGSSVATIGALSGTPASSAVDSVSALDGLDVVDGVLVGAWVDAVAGDFVGGSTCGALDAGVTAGGTAVTAFTAVAAAPVGAALR
jgi:hypothetical protein